MIMLYEEPQGYVGVTFDDETSLCYMHVRLHQWSVSEYKRYLRIFEIIKRHLKELVPEVYSTCKTEKDFKFNKLFGFEDTGLFVRTKVGNIEKLGVLKL